MKTQIRKVSVYAEQSGFMVKVERSKTVGDRILTSSRTYHTPAYYSLCRLERLLFYTRNVIPVFTPGVMIVVFREPWHKPQSPACQVIPSYSFEGAT